jgi:hypothetical protein
MKSLPLGKAIIINQSEEEEVETEIPKRVIEKKTVHGLGDAVHKIANPIARAIDRVAGTNIQGCGSCQKRKEYLNEKFPSN